jgi:hypothetical protein
MQKLQTKTNFLEMLNVTNGEYEFATLLEDNETPDSVATKIL